VSVQFFLKSAAAGALSVKITIYGTSNILEISAENTFASANTIVNTPNPVATY
jgi:hypothetical protein